MCGIVGFANWNNQINLDEFINAHSLLCHRGRDDEGFYVHHGGKGYELRGDNTVSELCNLPHVRTIENARLVLGHSRLSIIDLSANGHQPMQSPNGRFMITYNGEIYNYLELRQQLASLGYRFKTETDTEVLLACLEEWGIDCLARLNGMWSFAVLDLKNKCLILSRDRFGIKPLYYTILGDSLYFASEAKALLALMPSRKMNEQRVIEYLVSNYIDHHEQTVFDGINQLMAGHYAIWDMNGLQKVRYWYPPNTKDSESFEQSAKTLVHLLSSSVELRLRSDVPVGTLLSGGLDSTTIACLICQQRRRDQAAHEYDAFSAVFHESAFSEKSFTEDTIAKTQLPIHWVYPDAASVEEELPRLLYHQEFPVRSLSTFSQWMIMQAVAETPIKVLLNGQGSDELFAGYTQHYYALVVHYLSRLKLKRAWTLVDFLREERGISSRIIIRNLIAYLQLSLMNGQRLPLTSIDYLNIRYTPDIILPDGVGMFNRKLLQNLTLTALPEYLRYEDRNSMAFTLESRLPFLDYRLVEWAMMLPAEMKIQVGSNKHVLREGVRPLIPASVADRNDKMGFVTPQELWQRNELRPILDEVFAQDLQSIFPFIDQNRVRVKYHDYQENGIGNWAWVWRIACLYWWYQLWWG